MGYAAGLIDQFCHPDRQRLEQLSLYRSGSYDKWKRLVHNANPDYSEKKGGPPEPPAQEKVKLAKYGFQFARAFDSLLSDKA